MTVGKSEGAILGHRNSERVSVSVRFELPTWFSALASIRVAARRAYRHRALEDENERNTLIIHAA
jgi:hypothetical protein